MPPPAVVTHERIGRLIAGVSLLASVALGYFHHPAWLLLAAGTAINLAVSGLTGHCPVKRLLLRMGFPGERDVGRAEAIGQLAESPPARSASRLVPAESHEKAVVN
jgi:hypothetical protein